MSTVIITQKDDSPESPYALDIHLQTTLAIGPEKARRLVKRELLPQLGTGLAAHEPELIVQDEQITWRVPIVLSLPTVGMLGIVGVVPVDANSGAILLSEKQQHGIIDHARRLYKGSILQAE